MERASPKAARSFSSYGNGVGALGVGAQRARPLVECRERQILRDDVKATREEKERRKEGRQEVPAHRRSGGRDVRAEREVEVP